MNRRSMTVLLGLSLALLCWWLWPAPDTGPSVADLQTPSHTQAPTAAPPEFATIEAPTNEAVMLAGWQRLECPLPVDPIPHKNDLLVGILAAPDTTDLTWVAASIRSYNLVFNVPVSEGAGLVSLPGFEQASLVWWTDEEGQLSCRFSKDPMPSPRAVLHLTLDVPPGLDGQDLFVRVCNRSMAQDWINGPEPIELVPGPCEMVACMRHGAIWACGDALQHPLPAGEHRVTLGLPDFLPAGLPVTISYTSEGMRVTEVSPNTQADDLLRAGDHIVAIDGIGLDDLDGMERYTLATGPVDTEVVFEVEREGGERLEIALTREYVKAR